MKAMKQMKHVMLTLAIAFVMALAFSVSAKAELVTPGKVTGIKQVDAGSDLKITWTALLTNDVRYNVEVSTDKQNWVSKEDNLAGNSAQIRGLTAGSTYYVRVQGFTSERQNGEVVYARGAYSDVVECVTAPNEKVSYLKKIDSTTSSVTLEWPSVSGANAYKVKLGGAKTGETIIYGTGAKITYTITGLSGDAAYTASVYPAKANSTKSFVACNEMYYNCETIYSLTVTPGKVTEVDVPYYWNAIGELEVEYKRISYAEGYEAELYTANKKKDKKVASAQGNHYGIFVKYSGLKKHNFYKVRVRAYTTTTDGVKKYGAWSDWKQTCQQPDVKLRPTSNGMKVKFDKISGADRYVVYMSTKKDSGYKKVATTKKTSVTVKKLGKKKLKRGKTYYAYVVAYNKVGKKYYSGAAGNANSCWPIKY